MFSIWIWFSFNSETHCLHTSYFFDMNSNPELTNGILYNTVEIAYEFALRWMSLDLTDEKSALVQVMP